MDVRFILKCFILFALYNGEVSRGKTGIALAMKEPSKSSRKIPSTGKGGGTFSAKKVPSTGKGGTSPIQRSVPISGKDSKPGGSDNDYYYDEPTTTKRSAKKPTKATTTTTKPVITTTAEPIITTTAEPIITIAPESVITTTAESTITTTAEPVITATAESTITTTAEPVITTTAESTMTTTAEQVINAIAESVITTTAEPVITTTAESTMTTTAKQVIKAIAESVITTTAEPVITTTTKPTTTTTGQVATTTITEKNATTTYVASTTTTTSKTVPTTASIFKSSAKTSGIDVTKSLHAEIFKNYDTQVKPLKNQSDILHVQSLFIPNSLLEFDVRSQKLSILGYFRIDWTDELINWWPRLYDYTFRVKVPITDIWYPKLFITKAYGGDGHIGNTVTDIAQIAYRGWVQWVPDGTYSVVCDVDIKYYPFDEQICHFSYYIVGEDIDSVELHHEEDVDLSELEENSAWEFIGVTRNIKTISNNNHVDIQFRLRRRPNFVVFTLVTPLLMMASLNAGVFLVPIDSGEKGTFAITIVFSYSIYVTIVSNMFPSSSAKVSFLIAFIVILMSFSVISTLYVIIQAKLLALIAKTSIDQLNKRQEFFRKLDIIIFVVFTAFVISSTIGFFGLLLKMIS